MQDIGLALRRSEGKRATVSQVDGTGSLPFANGSFDRFVATYVLDLFPDAVIANVLHDVEIDGALIVSRGQSFLARMKPALPPKTAEAIAAVERHLTPSE